MYDDELGCNTFCKRKQTLQWKSVIVFFFICFFWHKSLPFFYNYFGRERAAQMSFYNVDAFQNFVPTTSDQTAREFASMGAFTHTVVFMFGLACASLIGFFVRQFVIEPIGIGACIGLLLWTLAVFHSMALRFLQFCFQTKFEPIYKFAHLFFKDEGGHSPFAWTSSVSYTTALLLGIIMSVDSNSVAFQKTFMPSIVLRQWLLWSGIPLILWLYLLDIVTLPFFNHVYTQQQHKNMVTAAKSSAIVLGLAMACVIPVCLSVARVLITLHTKNQYNIAAAFLHELTFLFQTIVTTSTIGLLFALVSLNEQVTPSSLAHAFLDLFQLLLQKQMLLLLMFFVSVVCILLVIAFSFAYLYDIVVCPRDHHLKRAANFLIVCLFWNCYLLGFLGSFMPFIIYAMIATYVPSLGIQYHTNEALMDGVYWVTYGSYLFPVVFHGFLKLVSVKFRWRWSLVQESILAVACIGPLVSMIHFYWSQNHTAFGIICIMTFIHLAYLLITYKNHPEFSESRFWPWFRQLEFWRAFQMYFDQHLIFDGEDINTFDSEEGHLSWGKNSSNLNFKPERDGHPISKVIGFHPHGIFPASMIHYHCTPLWYQLTGDLMPRCHVDSFVHVVPFLRDMAQWSGSKEVSREAVSKSLSDGHTIVIAPGGQAEILLHTKENSKRKVVQLNARHSGFVRIAMEHQAELVPSFSFGELQVTRNIDLLPWLQRFTRKYIGCPLPFLPVGLFGFLPIPNPTQSTWCLGKPIVFQCETAGEPTKEEVLKGQHQYFEALITLFDKYKATAGYPDWKMELLTK